jgi:hypothetical protein
MLSNQDNVKRKNVIIRIFEYVPALIDNLICWIDDLLGGVKTIKIFHNRSFLAFLLPVPVYIFIIIGPSLARDTSNIAYWRGGLSAVLLITVVLILQLVYFLQNHWRGLAWVQLGLTSALVFLTWEMANPKTVQASTDLYRHYYSLLALIAVLVSIPVAAWLRRRTVFAIPEEDLVKFHEAFSAPKVVDQGDPKKIDDIWDVVVAYFMVMLRRPLHVVAPVAIVVLAVSSEHLMIWTVIAFVLSLMLFATSIFDPEQDSFVRLFQHVFLSGGTLLVTLAIIIIAVLRLAGFDYVTTMLDAGSKPTLFSYIISTYSLFWFYDFWIDQAILDLVIEANGFPEESKIVMRHGGGRIAVVAKIDSDKMRKRMFEPAAFLRRIAQTSPLGIQESLEYNAIKAEQRFRTFASVCLLVFTGLLVSSGLFLHSINQAPGLSVKNKEECIFNLSEHLISSNKEPIIMLSASGGGTRAALYTTAVLRGLSSLNNHKINSLILASGVSGGSAALAYFAIHRPLLTSEDDSEWKRMNTVLSSPFIDDVFAGAAEFRIVSKYRLGQLLTESFQRRFLREIPLEEEKIRSTFSGAKDIGLIFNTSICGVSDVNHSSNNGASTSSAGGRLVITNLSSRFDSKFTSTSFGWEYDFPYMIVRDPDASLFAAASLSANFPPVFSNAAVVIDDHDFVWVTDGGAVENRGVISILLVLAETLESILANKEEVIQEHNLANIYIVVADASAIQPDYKSDRGLGAKFDASEQIANRLVAELIRRTNQLYKSISGKDNGIQVIYLPMPDSMRVSGTFGTHWMMPSTVTIKSPSSVKGEVELKSQDLIDLMDEMFLVENVKEFKKWIHRKWPKLDPQPIIEQTIRPWLKFKACLK